MARIRSPLPLLCATLTAVCAIPRLFAGDPPDADLKVVVALFRHGVRAPLETFGKNAGRHSKKAWPDLKKDWHVCPDCWGYLTPQGSDAVKILGTYYGSYYSKKGWPTNFSVYLWADVDQRTRATAKALGEGMRSAGASVAVQSRQPTDATDPLFHPFKANCGEPDTKHLEAIAAYINANISGWILEFTYPTRGDQLNDLYSILGCDDVKHCKPLRELADHAEAWSSPAPRPTSPIIWTGQFPYASSATEAFLLKYANGMEIEKVGWGHVINKETGSIDTLSKLLKLHEFYFDKTERELNADAPDLFLAAINGSNLVREIRDQLNKVIGKPLPEDCPRPSEQSQFVGLVGHDTNLASVQTLLNVRWRFDGDQQLPAGMRTLPENDALPAGALVFELRQTGQSNYKVRIQYVTQSLEEMRAPRKQ
ncbi:MAG TPA: histidine-type phosphatase, partial [Candidatus Udaeobacter sp.]|nr:histidine-type phosphatase [Candidatus Udaeobacter sp.]